MLLVRGDRGRMEEEGKEEKKGKEEEEVVLLAYS